MNKIEIKKDFTDYKKYFLEENSKLNLISKKEEQYLFEKHIYDSLGIKLFFEKYNFVPKTLLDIGTGGGFPSVPIAIEYPEISVTGIDSIQKKINAVQSLKNTLNIQNLNLIRGRVEELKNSSFDVITSRAVAKIETLIKYAYPLLKKDGYIILYKSKTAEDEITEAINLIRKLHLKIKPIIEYTLPLEETYNRCLVILQK